MTDKESSATYFPKFLSEFKFLKVLSVDSLTNTVTCHGTGTIDGKEEDALIFISKTSFEASLIPSFFHVDSPDKPSNEIQVTSLLQHNDRFSNLLACCDPNINPLFIKLVFPATKDDIKKVYI